MSILMNEKRAEEVAELLLSIQAASVQLDPPFTYTSGLRSPIYVDNRLILSFPEQRKRLMELYVESINEFIGVNKINAISGTATAAIPQAAFISALMNLPMVYARSSAKAHGKQKKLEGKLPENARVLIVEDHISTGGSAIDNASTVREEGGQVEFCIATSTYENPASEEAFKSYDIQLIVLTTGKIIVEKAHSKGIIDEKQKAMIDQWFEDPSGWYDEVFSKQQG